MGNSCCLLLSSKLVVATTLFGLLLFMLRLPPFIGETTRWKNPMDNACVGSMLQFIVARRSKVIASIIVKDVEIRTVDRIIVFDSILSFVSDIVPVFFEM